MRASFPSPPEGVVHLGPLPLRAYALFILIGIVVAVVTGERRMQARGYPAGTVTDIAVWAVPFGIVGGRLYHVITDHQIYFGAHSPKPWYDAFAIWEGGLGIWGAVALGALGAYIGARRKGIRFAHLADSVAVGIPMAQGIGRLGNYFNQELYGRPSTLPWAVRIDPAHRIFPNIATYQPTFLYELIWDFGVAGLVLWAERRWRLGRGRAFALYVAAYTVGRGWIEALRIDEAHRLFGLRLNDYTSIVVFAGAVAFLLLVRDRPADLPAAPAAEQSTPVVRS